MIQLPTHIHVGPIELVKSTGNHWVRGYPDCEKISILKPIEIDILFGNDGVWHGLVMTPSGTTRHSDEDLEVVVAKLTQHVPTVASLQVERARLGVLLEMMES